MKRKMIGMKFFPKAFAAAWVLASLGGCGMAERSVVVIEQEPYEGISYDTTVVQRGNLKPEFTLKLKVDGSKAINYSLNSNELTLDTLYVSVGQKVKAGDLLVSFQSEGLQEKIDGYKEQCDQYELLIDHYEKLMKADPDLDYRRDIEMMRQDMYLIRLYQEEAEAKLLSYQIVAEAPGTITAINEFLTGGILNGSRNLVTQVTGTGNYTVTTAQDYEFKTGEVYTAQLDVVNYDLSVSEVTWEEDKEGRRKQTVVFTPLSDTSALSDTDELTLVVKKPELKDVVYLDAEYVHVVDGRYFVYVQGENGFREAVFVTIGEQVFGSQVITSGLSGGEKVTRN